MKSDPEDTRRRALLASIDPRDVPTLFRGGVPTNVFPDVVAAALGDAAGKNRTGGPAFVELLEALTQTPRFDVAVLFVAGAAKKAMTRAWDEAIAAAAGRRRRAACRGEESVQSVARNVFFFFSENVRAVER